MARTTKPSPNADKTLSLAGLAFIKEAEEESGRPKLVAYDDGTGTATIGWGCTEGVTFGMRITVQQAHEMLDRELAKHIASVHRLVTRPISQGLFDLMVSFFFNHGAGNCPTLLKAVNSGSDDAIRRALMLYVKAYDKKLGKTVTWPGLVRRRTIEIAHWAKMDDMDPKVPTPVADARLPAPVEPPKPSIVATAAKSKSFLMQAHAMLLLVLGFLTDLGAQLVAWFTTLVGVAPAVTGDVQTVVDTTTLWTGWLKIDASRFLVPMIVASIGIAMVRHIRDKREIEQ